MSDPCELSELVADLREIAGNHDGEQVTAERAADVLLKSHDLLLRCYHAGHRRGWEEGETTDEVMDAVNAHLSSMFSADWRENELCRWNEDAANGES